VINQAEDDKAEIQLPVWHGMYQWRDSVADSRNMRFVGKLGDRLDFASLPPALQTLEMVGSVAPRDHHVTTT
jgi:hypothetical protein